MRGGCQNGQDAKTAVTRCAGHAAGTSPMNDRVQAADGERTTSARHIPLACNILFIGVLRRVRWRPPPSAFLPVYRILGERANSGTGKGPQTGTNPREFRRRMFSVGRVDPCPLWNLRRFTLCVSNRRTGEARRRPFGTCHSYSPPIPRLKPGAICRCPFGTNIQGIFQHRLRADCRRQQIPQTFAGNLQTKTGADVSLWAQKFGAFQQWSREGPGRIAPGFNLGNRNRETPLAPKGATAAFPDP